MKKLIIIPIVIILVASGLLVYDTFFKKSQSEWDTEMHNISSSVIRQKGDILVIDESFERKRIQGEMELTHKIQNRAVCSISKDFCEIFQKDKDGKWRKLGEASLSRIIGGASNIPSGKKVEI